MSDLIKTLALVLIVFVSVQGKITSVVETFTTYQGCLAESSGPEQVYIEPKASFCEDCQTDCLADGGEFVSCNCLSGSCRCRCTTDTTCDCNQGKHVNRIHPAPFDVTENEKHHLYVMKIRVQEFCPSGHRNGSEGEDSAYCQECKADCEDKGGEFVSCGCEGAACNCRCIDQSTCICGAANRLLVGIFVYMTTLLFSFINV